MVSRVTFASLLSELKQDAGFAAIATLALQALKEHPQTSILESEDFQTREEILKIQGGRLQRAERLQASYVYGMRETVDRLANSDCGHLKMLLACEDQFSIAIWVTPEWQPLGLILSP